MSPGSIAILEDQCVLIFAIALEEPDDVGVHAHTHERVQLELEGAALSLPEALHRHGPAVFCF